MQELEKIAGVTKFSRQAADLGAPEPQATILNSVAMATGRTWFFSRFISTKP